MNTDKNSKGRQLDTDKNTRYPVLPLPPFYNLKYRVFEKILHYKKLIVNTILILSTHYAWLFLFYLLEKRRTGSEYWAIGVEISYLNLNNLIKHET